MEFLASLLVHKPLNILLVAVFFGVCFVIRRFGPGGTESHALALLVVALGWALYAGWEWLVMVKTPEANIRVDLMVIWPLLLVLTLWGLIRALKSYSGAGS